MPYHLHFCVLWFINKIDGRKEEFMKTKDLIRRSIFIITEYFKNNTEPFFENISDDVLWIGPAQRQQMQGREKMIQAWAKEKHDLTFTMGNIKVKTVSPAAHVREIILHYDVYTHYPSGYTHLRDQRLHYTWREKRVKTEKGSEYRSEIVMLHVSNAFRSDKRDSIYPVHYDQIAASMPVLSEPERYITAKTTDMSVHRIAVSRILYIETVKQSAKLQIHTKNDTIIVCGTLLGFEKNYPGLFLRIHASYLLNPAHVRKIRRFRVTLSDGTELPIPEKKYTRIKAQLLRKDMNGQPDRQEL